ncbi:MAG: hypothetical protein EZS28_017341 [Streblomastix strix]|uniref:Uncharacterized protein n=1 Tax=Streblomastix strix TaxID=222440 RepID=A0A5J4VXR5_9EUKA|nr:MAG: hypothetical protein EZS28_017341 [Streblomastix strix]
MCSSGCGLNDYDDITSQGIDILDSIFSTIHRHKLNKKEQQIQDDIKDIIELEGLEEENDNLTFHSNRRLDINIKKKSANLKQQFNIQGERSPEEEGDEEANNNDEVDDEEKEEEGEEEDVLVYNDREDLFRQLALLANSK